MTLLDVNTLMVAVLSMNIVGISFRRSMKVLLVRKLCSAIIRVVHLITARISAFAESFEILRCMLLPNEYAAPLMVSIYALVDLRSGVT